MATQATEKEYERLAKNHYEILMYRTLSGKRINNTV